MDNKDQIDDDEKEIKEQIQNLEEIEKIMNADDNKKYIIKFKNKMDKYIWERIPLDEEEKIDILKELIKNK
jgi:hypothetical protein